MILNAVNPTIGGVLVRGEKGTATSAFLGYVRKKLLLLAGLAAATALLAVIAITQGAYDLTIPRVLQALVGAADGATKVVVWNIRMPRIIAALAVGWGLSLSGLSLQSLLKNPLGSPSTLGISQGAAFGAAASVVLFGARVLSTTAAAFAGAMAATLVILVLARLRRLSPESVILAGVAMSSLFASATVLIQYVATETQLAAIVFWTFGDVARSGWREIGLLSGAVVLTSVYLTVLRWDLNALASGEDTAKGLGVHVERVRIQGMAAAALVAALATAFHGVIAFVGLIAPHMARRLAGEDHRLIVPFSAVLGAILLLAADTVGRILIGSGGLPVGVVTSFLGAPMFLYLLLRGYR
ncbi:MAG: iron chelate uptake ABC transporter family permease subunit [Thermodesulfobacteriota bacterium]